jgi:hypothetical protein
LDIAVSEYQIHVSGEYSTWTGKLKDMGIEAKTAVQIGFQKNMTLENRVDYIKRVLEDSRCFTKEASQEVEQVYDILRLLYDPGLPKERNTTTFALRKLGENTAPWISMEALFIALNNWRKQYGEEISMSIQNLKDSLTSIINLGEESKRLRPVLEEKITRLTSNAEKARDIKRSIETKSLNIMNILMIRDVFKSSLAISRDVTAIFYEELKDKEETIDSLLPTKDFVWEKNVSLMNRMTLAMQVFSEETDTGMKKAFDNLPKFLSYLDECIETLVLYNEKKEFLLNYPIAAMVIGSLSKQNRQISAGDLPFEERFAEDYLKLYYSQNYSDYCLDESNMSLAKRT